MKIRLLFLFMLSFSCSILNAGQVPADSALQNSYVAIRSLVSFLEFSEAVRWECCDGGCPMLLIPGVSSEEIRSTLAYIEKVLPLSQRKEELLNRFGNQQFLEEVRRLSNLKDALLETGKESLCRSKRHLSETAKEYLLLLAQSVVIMVESLYKQNKIAAEHKDVVQRICETILSEKKYYLVCKVL